MEFLPEALQALAAYSQFIVYQLVPRGEKNDKLPINPVSLFKINPLDPKNWIAIQEALNYVRFLGSGFGVGFVFTEADPFYFLDLDGCLVDGKWSQLAIDLLKLTDGAAVEVSSSGKGLHIIGTGMCPPHACRGVQPGTELYTSNRFVALTGKYTKGDVRYDNTPILVALVNTYFPITNKAFNSPQDWTTESVTEVIEDDDQLIAAALNSKSAASAFGNRASFRDLWERNVEALTNAFSDPNHDSGYDESRADAALAQHLAFWTGKNCARIQGLMLQSALNRDKWERQDYLPQTILVACGKQKEVFHRKQPQDKPNGPVGQVESILNAPQQVEFFKGCTYVTDEHKILMPGGHLLSAERFKVIYGGKSFVMDNTNARVVRNAFEAFTESQMVRPVIAQSTCFRPDLKPAEIINQEGENLVNTWWPVTTPCRDGDITPFLNLLAKQLPDEHDRMILLSYMAAVVQYPGIKFMWCPLIQGTEGNGKTFLSLCVAYAVGHRYVHSPKAAEIASKFNDWIYRKIFISIEDIYASNNIEIFETLKPMITNRRLDIESKGVDKIMRDICANFIINTNHKDGLQKTRNDRRIAPFFTAQQSYADLERDGMLGNFFPNLFKWANDSGLAIIHYYLRHFKIPAEFNPAENCHRAPMTSTTQTAIESSRSRIEQELTEIIGEGRQGFKNGWISSIQLNRFFKEYRISTTKRADLIRNLGYVHHPALPDGRSNITTVIDSGKPRLFVLKDHRTIAFQDPVKVVREYENDQN